MYISLFVPNASQMFIKKRKFVNLHAALRVRPKQHRCILTRYLSSSRFIIAYYISQMNNFSWSLFASGIHSNRLLLVPIEWFYFILYLFIYCLQVKTMRLYLSVSHFYYYTSYHSIWKNLKKLLKKSLPLLYLILPHKNWYEVSLYININSYSSS